MDRSQIQRPIAQTYLSFAEKVRSVEVRIATSFISFEQAERNLHTELDAKFQHTLRSEGERVWNKHLKSIEIESAKRGATTYVLLLPVSHTLIPAHMA